MGADYGYFTEFDFQSSNLINSLEYTSIGYPANRAAKLEAVADSGELILSKEVYDIVKSDLKSLGNKLEGSKNVKIINKYSTLESYVFTAFNRIEPTNRYKNRMNTANDKYRMNIDNKRFSDIEFTDAKKIIDFDNLSLLNPKKVDAVVIYADIRGFTKKFKSDGSNLIQMSLLTKEVLTKMYTSVVYKQGTHIQFQGDRESAIRNDFGTEDYVLKGLQIAMYILEQIITSNNAINHQLSIGIGCSFGKVYAAKVGIKSHKHNLIMGEAVKEANIAEDEFADNNEIAITKDMYNHLLFVSNSRYMSLIKQIFRKKGLDHYVTKYKFSEFNRLLTELNLQKNAEEARMNNAQRPWHNVNI
jgi:class 3 adenylate cyclase